VAEDAVLRLDGLEEAEGKAVVAVTTGQAMASACGVTGLA